MTHKSNNNRVNVYQMVTDRIVAELEKGIIPWQKPWSGAGLADGGAVNYVSRKPYSYLNQMLLGRSGEFLTFKQVKELGGSVKKGAESQVVVFYTKIKTTKKVTTPEGEEKEEEKLIPYLRYYRVFHLDDTTGIESKIKVDEAGEAQPENTLQPVEQAEAIVNGYISREDSPKFENNKPSDRAYYSPSLDKVVVPMLSQYQEAEEYYSTTFHELVHSTMKKSRCDRTAENKMASFGSADYSREELVAELGSAMLSNLAGLDSAKAFKNSVAYIQSWLKALKNDNKMIVWASGRAEKASKFIIGKEQ